MELQIIEHSNQRVLTTSQLAEVYETDNRRISENFNRNKERFRIGKHFIVLSGEEKKEFLNCTQIADSSKNAQVIYLWTEKGAWLHAKSLNTDKAWDAYEFLVDRYYTLQGKLTQPSNLELMLEAALKHERAITVLESDVKTLKNTMRVDTLEQKNIQDAGNRAALRWLGGKESNAYQDRALRTKVYSSMWRDFKKYFNVPRYGDLPKVKHKVALNFLNGWRPEHILVLEVGEVNKQEKLF